MNERVQTARARLLAMDRAFKNALISAINSGEESAAAITATVRLDYRWNIRAKAFFKRREKARRRSR